ncbi:MAG: aminopeptidase [Bacteroidales bacterium]|nr:aminopeptidase [Bacteroidales bacterium]MCF8390943.1 aminopeptidase [Bacteroidales bacterium]
MKSIISLFVIGLTMQLAVTAQTAYEFTDVKTLKTTSVKDQHRSGTCWSFSGISFFESELLRMDKGEFDLSEMYVVRNAYADKAEKYVRLHGSLNFAGGGAFNDVSWVMKNFGIVPEEAYKGIEYGTDGHVHGELDILLKAYMDAVIENKNRELSSSWLKGLNGILDAYLGKYPEKFMYNGKEYTPQSFMANLGLNMDDYVMLSSFTHHPFYKPFILEVPDNWAWGEVYNVKIEELTQVIDNSLAKGYTVAWATDVSEKGFQYNKGLAVVPTDDIEDMDNLEKGKWEAFTDKEKLAFMYDFSSIKAEKKITQELRQEAFDNYQTTDDHGMHIVGTAKDQNGTEYYKVKNSWGIEDHVYGGYLYVSKAFVEYKTLSILVNKNAIPKKLREELGL